MARTPRTGARQPAPGFVDREGNPLTLPEEESASLYEVPAEFRDSQWDRQWVRTTCLGQVDQGNMNREHRAGWRPVTWGQMPGYLNDGSDPDLPIEHEGLMLVERPVQMSAVMKERHERRNLEQLRAQAEASVDVTMDLRARGVFESRPGRSFIKSGGFEEIDPKLLRDGGQPIA